MMNRTDESAFLRFLYRTVPGRMLLRPLCSRAVSRLCGAYMDSPLSKPMIRPFLRRNGINTAEYLPENYRCFNDCFTRRIRPELRPVDPDPDALISPCDGLLSVYPIKPDGVYPIKQSAYSVEALLQNETCAKRFEGGYCFVFRLCVQHYHRYSFPADGTKENGVFIAGKLHTVRPIALRTVPVFTENCREYTILHTDRFGTLAQAEVGAMLVGKIKNHDLPPAVKRGQEKGMFLYGGSTVLLLTEPNRVRVPEEWLAATARGEETPVKAGQRIGKTT